VIGDRRSIAGQLARWDQHADIVSVCVGPDEPDAVLAAVETAAPPTRSPDARDTSAARDRDMTAVAEVRDARVA